MIWNNDDYEIKWEETMMEDGVIFCRVISCELKSDILRRERVGAILEKQIQEIINRK